MKRVGIVVLLFLAVSSACSGSDGDGTRSDVRSTAKAFFLALGRANYEGACNLLSPTVKSDWAGIARRNPHAFPDASCPTFAEDFYGRYTRRDLRRLRRGLRILDDAPIEIAGRKAVITMGRRPKERLYLERVQNRWLMTTKDAHADS